MKFTDNQLKLFNNQMVEVVKKGMTKYKKIQGSNKVSVLNKSMNIEAA